MELNTALSPGWMDMDSVAMIVLTDTIGFMDSTTVSLTLTVLPDNTDPLNLINVSEISAWQDTVGYNITNLDQDSDGDTDPDNDGVPAPGDPDDNNIFGEATEGEDEDDSDPAGLQVFDLALKKTTAETGPFTHGDIVTYDFTVYNQGNIPGANIEITEFTPCGFVFDPSINTGWTAGAGNTATTLITNTIQPGDSATVSVDLIVQACDAVDAWKNIGEISASEDDAGNDTSNSDVDSDSDNDPTNDGDMEDNAVDGENEDEDDSDFEVIEIFDLALIKTVASSPPYLYGNTITFDITVYNQGTIPSTNITVSDSIPSGFLYDPLNNFGWSGTAPVVSTIITDTIQPMDSATVSIKLELMMSQGSSESYTNIAEISMAQDTTGMDGTDADSDPDTNFSDDAGGDPYGPSDNQTDGDGTDDEDDHDPAVVEIFDLALNKTTTWTGPVTYGDIIPFQINVSNQGNIPATNIEVTDYIPCGYIYQPANNPLWSHDAASSTATATINGPLNPGDTYTLDIYLAVQPCAGDPTDNWTNGAEISYTEDEEGNDRSNEDIDSTPDDNPTNDGPVEDNITDNTNDDEDDHDTEMPEIFDLALQKVFASSNATPITLGTDVTFSIIVYNQGTLPAANIEISDYIPTGYVLSTTTPGGWTDANGDGIYENSIPGPIAVGDSMSIDIVLTVQMAMSDSEYVNVAEISGAEDDAGNDMTNEDIDSDTDNNPNNDSGGQVSTPDDNEINENGENGTDEDDADPAFVPIEYTDLALTKMLAPGQIQTVMPGALVDFEVTIYNQGAADAYNVSVIDYVPTGLTYNDAFGNNAALGWSDADADGNPEIILTGPITAYTDSLTVLITLQVDPALIAPATLTNTAEITGSEDEEANPQTDIDSTPDDTPNNETGEVDDAIDDPTDEDDSDPAIINIMDDLVYDLALAKTLDPSVQLPVYVGDTVVYNIEVINQGSETVTNVEISDYMGACLAANGPIEPNGWMDTDNDGIYENVIAGPMLPGQRDTLQMEVVITCAPTTPADITNTAEISAMDDEDGNPVDDIDSTPDMDPTNDGIPIDNATEDPNDEDDHDPEVIPVEVFDLALIKKLSPTSPAPMPGGDVHFDIEVCNQGTVAAYNIEVVDYPPAGLTLSINDAFGWTDINNDGNYENSIAAIPAGQCKDVTIILTIDPSATGPLINQAEITDAEDENGDHPTDIDSTPNDNPNDDAMGDNDQTDGDGTDDEDDHDWEEIMLGSWDLALVKKLAVGQSAYIMVGDDVNFTIEVINQGTMDSYNIDLAEYLPTGMTLSAADTNGWTDADNDGVLENTIAGPLAIGTSQFIDLVVTVDPAFAGNSLENNAEISDFEDGAGNHPLDNDSHPDDDPTNDPFGMDNQEDGNGTDDEDDHDPEIVFITDIPVYDLALEKEVDPATIIPVYAGDDVTFFITVTNQGNTTVQNVDIVDYLPTGATLSTADTNGWVDTNADGNPENMIAGPMMPGDTAMLAIVITIDPTFTGTSLENRAEISEMENEMGTPVDDIDSDPDDTPGDPEIEDDEDGDEVPLSVFDLALIKVIAPNGAPMPIMPGDEVTFRIKVFNQGSIAAYNIDLAEYIPAGLSLSTNDTNGWVDSNADGIFENTITGPIIAGMYEFVDIVLTVDPATVAPATFENEAEITDAEDENGNHPTDIDSTPDDDPNNDNTTNDITDNTCLLYTSPSPRDLSTSRMPSSA